MIRFERFDLDPANRRLRRDGVPVELNARYFDALALLVREAGELVTKTRFHDEVWRGVPVTDEALTQCIRTLRQRLGDDAARPRFIETVPKHGYRFVAAVDEGGVDTVRRPLLGTAVAGTIGGAAAGAIGGLVYGFVGGSLVGGGAVSLLLVLLCVCILVAAIGAGGVSVGVGAAERWRGAGSPWSIAGGASGGLVVGALVKLVGTDGFALLLGRSPGDVTGAPEGALIGGAVGAAAWLARSASVRRGFALGALGGGIAGAAVALLGGRMLAGSLELLAEAFPGSRLAALLAPAGLGDAATAVTGALEGALFGACIVAAITFARTRSA